MVGVDRVQILRYALYFFRAVAKEESPGFQNLDCVLIVLDISESHVSTPTAVRIVRTCLICVSLLVLLGCPLGLVLTLFLAVSLVTEKTTVDTLLSGVLLYEQVVRALRRIVVIPVAHRPGLLSPG